MKRIYLLATLWAITAQAAPPLADPDSAGFVPQRLQRLNGHLQGFIDRGDRPGIVTIVSRGGNIVQFGEFGVRDVTTRKPLRADTLVRAYQMTEPVIAVAALALYEEGRFQLDDPIAQYIPELATLQVLKKQANGKLTRVPTTRAVTIRHLLTHTAGLSYSFPTGVIYKREALYAQNRTLAEIIPDLAKLPLMSQPGEAWNPSPSYDVLARLIEVIAGQPIDQFLEQRIFRPLAMIDTGFRVPQDKRDRFAEIYQPAPPKAGEKPTALAAGKAAPPAGLIDPNAKYLSGADGLITTAVDYWTFAQMLASRGDHDGTRILSPATVAMMMREQILPKLAPSTDAGQSFGFGVNVLTKPDLYGVPAPAGIVSRSGIAGTTFWIDPDQQIVGVLVAQYLPKTPSRLERDFQTLVYQAVVD